ncbi:hypothetical protein [Streptomyces sp. NPDC029554]|uniref:hypothetical protein n=1 Tax=Streptomyces sp. NPDC029554 TaxID=3155126 RepID=UPI0033E2C852
MTYADNPKRLARLLRDLAQALEDSGVNPIGATNERLPVDTHPSAALLIRRVHDHRGHATSLTQPQPDSIPGAA